MPNRYKLGGIGAIFMLSACVTPMPELTDNVLLARTSPQLAQAVRANPSNNEVWFQLGNSFAENDQLIEAEAAYRQALMLGPHAKALHNLGLVHIRLGIEALRSSSEQLPADHPSRLETRKFLELMAEAGY